MTAAAVSATAMQKPDTEEKASLRTWVSMFGCMLGTLMSVLDIQVTNSSLPQIEGGIGTGGANGDWISTAYLIGEIVMIPLADYLSRVFSFRRLLLSSIIAFLTFSIACAFAASLSQMIMLRGFQGFFSGAMMPMAMTYVLANIPRRQQPIGIAVFAMTVTFGPAIGPTLGGYLTNHFGWQYIFFVNLVPGAVMLALLFPTLKPEKAQLGLLKEGDWLGIAFMVVGLACLQTVLQEGNRYNWFGSPYIVKLSAVAGISLVIFVVIELTVKKPVVELRLLTYRNFGLGTVANILIGCALFGFIYVLPTYLDDVQGYNAEQVGMVMAWAGLPQLVIIPFVPYLVSRFDARVLVGLGLVIFAMSCFMNVHLSQNFGGDQFMISNVVRAVGQAIVMSPLTIIVLYGLPKALSGQASGVFNMMRNLGGAFGTAMLATILSQRQDFHVSHISSAVGAEAEQFLIGMQAYFREHSMTDIATATHQAEIVLAEMIRQQALIMAYSDAFMVMGVLLLLAMVAVALTRAPRPG